MASSAHGIRRLTLNLEHCYVNIPACERNYPVYRIISLDRLCELFEKRVNTLVKPIAWDDPFENFILELKGRLPSGEVVEFAQRYDFYGQCWTLVGGSDAMWRIYSSDKRSVRIKVRLKSLVQTLAPNAIGIVLLGKVRYLDTEGLLSWAKRVLRDAESPDVRLLGRTLLVKRAAFSHEREMRLLYFESQGDQPKLFQYRVDPSTFVEEIVVDPRLLVDEAKDFIEEIKKRTAFRGPITHSGLYAAPQEFVLRLGAAYSSLPRQSRRVTYTGDLRTTTDSPALSNTQILLPVPDLRFPTSSEEFSFVDSGPILCAGVTTYKGLKETDARPGEWVVISGVGGLGISRFNTPQPWNFM